MQLACTQEQLQVGTPSLPLVKQLHWFPVVYQIKLATVTYHTLSTILFLVNLLHFSDIPRTLRSHLSPPPECFPPKIKLKHAFSAAAPTIWNQLPITIKSSETVANFCIKKPLNIVV